MSRKGLSILVAIAMLFIVAAALTPKLPYREVLIHETSMSPTWEPGGAVTVHAGASYQLGQPVAFMHKGELVVHRYVRDNGDGTITTKGDANITADTWLTPKGDVIGPVVAYSPYLGEVLYMFDIGCPFHFPTGEVAVVLLVLLVLVIRWAFKKPQSVDQPEAHQNGPPTVEIDLSAMAAVNAAGPSGLYGSARRIPAQVAEPSPTS